MDNVNLLSKIQDFGAFVAGCVFTVWFSGLGSGVFPKYLVVYCRDSGQHSDSGKCDGQDHVQRPDSGP